MSVIVYAAPYVPPPPPASPWEYTRHTLTGADGVVWDVTDPRSGVFLTTDGVRGMGKPDWILHHTVSPVIHGARYHGAVAPQREVMLPLFLYHDGSSAGWTERYRAFMRNMQPDLPVLWTVIHPGSGESRSLTMRFVDDGGDIETQDSRGRGWKRLNLNFVADERPFWEGATVVREWHQSEQVDFFDPLGSPPFHLSQSLTLGGATVTNLGDEPAWPVWDLYGPMTSATVGVDGRFIDAPIVLAAGESLRINTRPGSKSAYDGTGARRTPELGRREWAVIPAGDSVPLSITMDGTGTVRVSFTPAYHEAY